MLVGGRRFCFRHGGNVIKRHQSVLSCHHKFWPISPNPGGDNRYSFRHHPRMLPGFRGIAMSSPPPRDKEVKKRLQTEDKESKRPTTQTFKQFLTLIRPEAPLFGVALGALSVVSSMSQ